MIKNLFKLWSTEQDTFDEMLKHFEQMLHRSEKLYHEVTDALFLGGNLQEMKKAVSESDHVINKNEQSIRRQIVTFLSAGSQFAANLNSCLVLMSVVKDVERLGDYAKNIFEVFEKTSKLDPGVYNDRLLEIRNSILQAFKDVDKAFSDGDAERARAALKVISENKNKCDGIVAELLVGPQEANAVAFALLARFFKRTLAHLGNIATSVIMPLDKLDYFDENQVART